MREYRRDVGRYLSGETNNYPLPPYGYFDRTTDNALAILREKAMSCRSAELLGRVAAAVEKTQIENTWQSSATRIYRNWLQYIHARKTESIEKHQVDNSLSISR